MWCIDLQQQKLSRKDGVNIHFCWTEQGELQQTLDNANAYSMLRKEMLLTETRSLMNNGLIKHTGKTLID